MRRDGFHTDLTSVGVRLKELGFEISEGELRDMQWWCSAPSLTPDYYAFVRKAGLRTRAYDIARGLVDDLAETDRETAKILEKRIDELARVVNQIESGSDYKEVWRNFKDALRAAWARCQDVRHYTTELVGLPTPFRRLNELTGGLQPKRVTVLGGDTSAGKTAMVCQIILANPGAVIGIVSPDMNAQDYVLRLLSLKAGVTSFELQQGAKSPVAVSDDEFRRVGEIASQLEAEPIFINDTPSLDIKDLERGARRLATRHGLHLLVVDYLQKLRDKSEKHDRLAQEVGSIANRLHALSKELNCHLLVVSQFRRRERRDSPPTLSDLKESGEIENAVDHVLLLWKSDKSDVANLNMAKQRHGPSGKFNLWWNKDKTRFEEPDARVEDKDL